MVIWTMEGQGSAQETTVACDICGHPMVEWNCELICTRCGFRRDCSDP